MKKTLRFNVSIEAPKQLVWKTMLDPDGYTAWTAPFCEGSYFSGSWDSGAKIKFLAPGGDHAPLTAGWICIPMGSVTASATTSAP